jgi:GTP cyclohydrolase IA
MWRRSNHAIGCEIRLMKSQKTQKTTSSAPVNGQPADENPREQGMPDTGTVDEERIRRAVREILLAVGEDPDREGLRETPDRVARMYAEVFQGLHQDPRIHVKTLFTQKHDEMVVVRDIQFESFCEHHLMPFTGRAHVGYLPKGKVVGLSKIPRVIDVLARRPQMQERLTEEVADLLVSELEARGVGVVMEASHTCMTIRGVHKASSSFVTSAMRGAFRDKPATRAEFLALIRCPPL